jgi:hypothetical protein
MIEALKEEFSDVTDAQWTDPDGGLFVWTTLPDVDTMEMFKYAEQRKVFYIPGEAFRPYEEPSSSMRMSFCLPSFEQIKEGVHRLKWAYLDYVEARGLKCK